MARTKRMTSSAIVKQSKAAKKRDITIDAAVADALNERIMTAWGMALSAFPQEMMIDLMRKSRAVQDIEEVFSRMMYAAVYDSMCEATYEQMVANAVKNL